MQPRCRLRWLYRAYTVLPSEEVEWPRLVWVRAGDRYLDLAGAPDHFIALDGEEEVGGA